MGRSSSFSSSTHQIGKLRVILGREEDDEKYGLLQKKEEEEGDEEKRAAEGKDVQRKKVGGPSNSMSLGQKRLKARVLGDAERSKNLHRYDNSVSTIIDRPSYVYV